MHLELLTRQVCNLTRAVGGYIRNESTKLQSTDIKVKEKHSLVTYVDTEAEKRLVEDLSKLLPEAGFISEENDKLEKAEIYNWIIDPLDGTTNFIHGFPVYSISVGLMRKNEVIAGVVFDINQQECFYSWESSPAYLNRNEIRVTETSTINDSLFAAGFPYADYSRLDDYLGIFKSLVKDSRGVRRLGSAALDMAYVACGRLDGFFEYGLNPWDVAAGSILIQNAGGVVSDFEGGTNFIFGKELLASNTQVFNKFLDLIKKHYE